MSLTTLRPWTPRLVDDVPVDQARSLRALLDRRDQLTRPATNSGSLSCRTIAITSGKGGVGKSVLAVNLAVSLAQQGQRVVLFDGNLGVGNIDLLCGLNSYWNLSHVVAGSRSLADITLTGPAGIHVIPGASGLTEIADCPSTVQHELLLQLQELESGYDFLIVDTGSGIHRLVRQFAAACDDTLVMTTPEPTSIADAYATIKALHGTTSVEFSVVVNQSSVDQAERILERMEATAKMFLRTGLKLGSAIPFDPAVPHSVRRRTPVIEFRPSAESSRAIHALADRLAGQPHTPRQRSFFARLWQGIAGIGEGPVRAA